MLLIANDGRFTMAAVNAAHAGAFRTTVEALQGRGLFEVFPDPAPPAAQAFMDSVRRSLERVQASGRADQMPVMPYAVTAADGGEEERFWTATQTPVFDASGALTHILSTVRDITPEVKERQMSEARALLMREVDHRARNALTVVQAILRLTRAEEVDAFREVALGRIEALARAQTSLARRKWEGANLEDVVRAELSALAFAGAARISGPSAVLPAEKVQAMSMILHELATNAVKYGALASPQGVVSVEWTCEGSGVELVWRETGGPPAHKPARAGFGSRLIRQLAHQLGGTVRYVWRAEGLCVELTAQLS
jgi:two-component sensor histidine kinase